MKNIILIGMPSCGKSSVGVVLAKAMGYRFVDSDILIQESEGRLLSEIIEEDGLDAFEAIENTVNSSIDLDRHIIATGGSVVYGKEAMEHLKSIGAVVYIKLELKDIKDRLGDLTSRGVAIREGQTIEDLYEERIPLYKKYADVTVEPAGLNIRETVAVIKDSVEEYWA